MRCESRSVCRGVFLLEIYSSEQYCFIIVFNLNDSYTPHTIHCKNEIGKRDIIMNQTNNAKME